MCKYTKNKEPCIYENLKKCIYCDLTKFQFNYTELLLKKMVPFMIHKSYTCPYYESEN